MNNTMHFLTLTCLAVLFTGILQADCPYDHLLIGCNRDGEPNTLDDQVLYLDTQDLYRRSDPGDEGAYTWLNWFYPMKNSGSTWFNTNPGFGMYHHPDEPGNFQFNDPNRCLIGTKSVDYSIMIECLDISPNLQVKKPPFTVVFSEPGDTFNHSGGTDATGHIHFTYTVPVSGDALHWITFRIYDAFFNPAHPEAGYRPSDPVTVVFGSPPSAGDIHVDGRVDILDLEKLAAFWLRSDDLHPWNSRGQAACDLFDRADINRDYRVDLLDYQFLSEQWNEL